MTLALNRCCAESADSREWCPSHYCTGKASGLVCSVVSSRLVCLAVWDIDRLCAEQARGRFNHGYSGHSLFLQLLHVQQTSLSTLFSGFLTVLLDSRGKQSTLQLLYFHYKASAENICICSILTIWSTGILHIRVLCHPRIHFQRSLLSVILAMHISQTHARSHIFRQQLFFCRVIQLAQKGGL